jgi:FtsH-binding integral membrane protein
MRSFRLPSGSARGAQPVPHAVSLADTPVRMAFLRKVYSLFSLAILTFFGTMAWGVNQPWVMDLFGSIGFIGFIAFFAGIFFLARVTASKFPLNLIGLAAFAVGYGLFMSPFVGMVLHQNGPGVILQAFMLTVAVFGSLTAYVFITKKDFSWMRGALWMAFALMFGLVILSMFGIGGGLVSGWGYSAAMVVLMGGFALYDTSMILHRYPANMAASAALAIFMDFILMFVYILSLLSRRD